MNHPPEILGVVTFAYSYVPHLSILNLYPYHTIIHGNAVEVQKILAQSKAASTEPAQALTMQRSRRNQWDCCHPCPNQSSAGVAGAAAESQLDKLVGSSWVIDFRSLSWKCSSGLTFPLQRVWWETSMGFAKALQCAFPDLENLVILQPPFLATFACRILQNSQCWQSVQAQCKLCTFKVKKPPNSWILEGILEDILNSNKIHGQVRWQSPGRYIAWPWRLQRPLAHWSARLWVIATILVPRPEESSDCTTWSPPRPSSAAPRHIASPLSRSNWGRKSRAFWLESPANGDWWCRNQEQKLVELQGYHRKANPPGRYLTSQNHLKQKQPKSSNHIESVSSGGQFQCFAPS